MQDNTEDQTVLATYVWMKDLEVNPEATLRKIETKLAARLREDNVFVVEARESDELIDGSECRLFIWRVAPVTNL